MDEPPMMLMANNERLIEYTKNYLRGNRWKVRDKSPLFLLRSIISSPRLTDIYVHDYNTDGLMEVGDTYLSEHTMLSDLPRPTYGMSIRLWSSAHCTPLTPEQVDWRDGSMVRLQLWPFDPYSLNERQLRLAVAVSFTDLELLNDPRLSGALEELLEDYNIDSEFKYNFQG